MKKGKIGILLSSVVAGLGLVGATFAAWAVTDNADPFGIKISPKEIATTSTEYSTMVLTWEDKTKFTNVSELQLGVAQYKEVAVRSDVVLKGSDAQTGGNLSIQLSDLTPSHVENAAKLIDNLYVKVYTTKTGTENPVYSGEIADLRLGGSKLSANKDIAIAVDTKVQTLYFEFLIPSSGDNAVTAVQYNQMISDQVYLVLDWNKPSTVTPVSKQTVYFKAPSTISAVNAYAFKETSGSVVNNHTWPGVAMTEYDHAAHIWQIEVDMVAFNKIIFSYTDFQTEDLGLPAIADNTPYYDGSGWKAVPQKTDYQEPVYYLVGTFNMSGTNWIVNDNNYKLTNPDSNGVYTIDLVVPEGGVEFKVYESTTDSYYSYFEIGGGDNNCNWGSAGTITISFSPNKTLVNNTQYINAVAKA